MAQQVVLASNCNGNHIFAWGEGALDRANAESPPGGPFELRRSWPNVSRQTYSVALATMLGGQELPAAVFVKNWSDSSGVACTITGIEIAPIAFVADTTIAVMQPVAVPGAAAVKREEHKVGPLVKKPLPPPAEISVGQLAEDGVYIRHKNEINEWMGVVRDGKLAIPAGMSVCRTAKDIANNDWRKAYGEIMGGEGRHVRYGSLSEFASSHNSMTESKNIRYNADAWRACDIQVKGQWVNVMNLLPKK